MPLYLVHGFRWPRTSIKRFIILNNIDDAAPEYIVSPGTSAALRDSLTDKFPQAMRQLPDLRFLEQYNPEAADGNVVSQPFAFVADKVSRCELSLDVTEAQSEGIDNSRWGALLELKEELAPNEKLGWYMIYNADEVRTHISPPLTNDKAQRRREDEKFSQRLTSGKLKKILSK